MRHHDIIEGSLVCLRQTNMLDENGEPWTHGAGPFTVARVYRKAGYREPWIRLCPVVRPRGPMVELPGSFRAKELRAASAKESTEAESAFWAAKQLAPTTVDVGTISEYGLTQKLSNPVRCF